MSRALRAGRPGPSPSPAPSPPGWGCLRANRQSETTGPKQGLPPQRRGGGIFCGQHGNAPEGRSSPSLSIVPTIAPAIGRDDGGGGGQGEGEVPMSTAPRGAIERIRGMDDVWPAERAFRQGIIAALERGFAAHGYRPLDTPVVEATELFLRKSGEERAAQMYAFDYRNRQIALRPEFTASVVRAYV